ncbi:MAG: hypothetical protein IPN17_06615 [Deltaproteobacteria bacterium]|nr:hypothetical protein [Deltaproteobacteria bacterium]
MRWVPGALDAMNASAEASGQYVLRGLDGEVAKLIELGLRFDLASR